ncbi:uncharacterized protein LOC130527965 isoform X3 [Takifugu flavidus]|uniref:uncharacterized protein LOC130527965 isoform X3 n=1 Tax=Takifugu flavidus TaxID=433684 RepID=UPI0025443DB9|nr:uncharacterized protein LOC130527965 isoform X3 [Takifugu flavidus]
MSGKMRRENSPLIFAVVVYLQLFRTSDSVSLWHRDGSADRITADNQHLDPDGNAWTVDNRTWTAGLSRRPRASAPNSADGEQADFTGFQGTVVAPPFPALVTTSPSLLCEDDAMTFTASGEIFSYLLVDRDGAPPISPLQLPPYCGYSVKPSWDDVQLMMPYDACYVRQENGSYVLPLLWSGDPLKLLCPVHAPAPSPSPSVFCSSYGMAVQVEGQQPDMRATVNGAWVPFVSEQCGQIVSSDLGQLTLFISYSAPCLTLDGGLQLRFIKDGQEYVFICPELYPYPDGLVPPGHAPTHPPQIQGHVAPFPDYGPYSGFYYLQLPPVYPPGLQTVHAPHLTPDSPPGPPLSLQQLTQLSSLIGPPSPGEHPGYPHYQHPLLVQAPSFPGPIPEVPVYLLPLFSPFYHVPPTALPPAATSEPPKADVPQLTCPPYTGSICGYYSYYDPLYQPLYPPGLWPVATATTPPATTQPTTSSAACGPTTGTLRVPSVKCRMENVTVFLPFANPVSIQVRDFTQRWRSLSELPPHCNYKIKAAQDPGVIFYSPLPACQSETKNSTTISLLLRYLDLSVGAYEVLEVQCPHGTPAPVPAAPSPRPPSTTGVSPPVVPNPKVLCSSHQMAVELPAGAISGIYVKDIKGNQVKLRDAPKDCGYSVRRNKHGKIQLRFQLHLRCHMSEQGQRYSIVVGYVTEAGRQENRFSCPVLIPEPRKECHLPSKQRLPCGPGSGTKPQCLSQGCCFSVQPPTCYYSMDACTLDQHFVFSVPATLVDPPLSPAMLFTLGNSTCKPERVTSDYALFKIPMDGCGAHKVVVGKTLIYMVEIFNMVQTLNLSYGTITRDSPFRLLVECRYLPDTVQSVSYMVKTPSLGSAVSGLGVFGVQLRIAKDAQYSSYYPQYHRPLQKLLGKPLYLELRLLNNSDTTVVLLVHYCVAYPRSGNAVWILLYNGCPNPLDPGPQRSVLLEPPPPSQGHVRRFTINTFQFLQDAEVGNQEEEIYFMCSTEVCSRRDGPCMEGCFGQQRSWGAGGF